MTEQQALELCIKVWNEIKQLSNQQGFEQLFQRDIAHPKVTITATITEIMVKHQAFAQLGLDSNSFHNSCPCCEYAYVDVGSDCSVCSIEQWRNDDNHCGEPYERWFNSLIKTDFEQMKQHADEIIFLAEENLAKFQR